MNIYSPQLIRDVLTPLGFHFSKARGQNFLIDELIPERMADLIPPGSGVLEIGPGFGALTEKLLDTADGLVAVEVDNRLAPVLRARYHDQTHFTLVEGDALALDLDALAAEHFDGLTPRVAANLPYSITSDILTKLVESPSYASMLLMVQKEVALRLTASPGKKDYGSFTIFVRVFCEAELLFDVPPESFMPRPGVMSAVMRLIRREAPLVPPEMQARFFRVTRAAFAQRRKTLLNALSAGFSEKSKEEIAAALERAGLDTQIRGETLGVEEFLRLTNEI